MRRRIFTLFLALAMIFALATGVSAAETENSPALQLEVAQGENEVVISVYLNGCADVTNGRFIVEYDSQLLSVSRVETTAAYAVDSVNTNTPGQVALAWVGSNLTAEKTLMLTVYLKVEVPITQEMTYKASAEEMFTETGAVEVADAVLTLGYIDYSALQAAIEAALEVNPALYTPESYAAVEAALNAGMELLNDSEATQEQVDAAAKALLDAIAALELLPEPPVDKSQLQAAVDNAQALNPEEYTQETFEAVQKALAEAEAVLADEEATQEQVDAAAKALNDAVAALEKVPEEVPVDFTELEKAIALAEKLDGDAFTTESFKVLEDALAQAKLVLVDPLATQEQVDLATKNLNDAIAALEKVGDDTPPTGDRSNMGLFALLVVLSLAAVAGMLVLIARARKQENITRLLSILLVVVMMLTMLPAGAIAAGLKGNGSTGNIYAQQIMNPGWDLTQDQNIDPINPNGYKENDLVHVIVELDDKSLLEQGYSKGEIAAYGGKVAAYARALKTIQNNVSAQIAQLAGSSKLLRAMSKEDQAAVAQVKYQYTVALNGVAMSLPYGLLDAVRKIDGVKAVYICSEYRLPDEIKSTAASSPTMYNSGNMVGAGKTWNELGYTGKGMTIAIIDTGLDLDHPSFAAAPDGVSMGLEDVEKVLTELNAYYLYGETSAVALTADKLYRSEKIPFAFNYVDRGLDVTHDYDSQGDHGTHVAGSAAANKLDTTDVVGVAPDAQVLVMKVFGQNGGAYTEDIMAALEDCILLDVDSVNMSLGAPGGFTEEHVLINEVFGRVLECDMALIVAAGNSNSAAYGNGLGTNLNLTSDPDNGITTSPGTYISGTQVGSFENSFVMMPYFAAGELKIPYVDVSMGFTALANQELTYVMIPGYGVAEDFEGLDLQGKVAVISRGGDVTFVDKQFNAYQAGAVAVVVYNNVENELLSMFDAGYLPNIFITKESGEKLLAEAGEDREGTMVIKPLTEEIPMESPVAGTMSDFSSWGVTSDLLLAPDVSAPGGNIYSCINDGKYGTMSGTSMASPHVAGMAVLLLQYLREEHPELSEAQMHVAVESLLMCTAQPMVDPDGILYSPRKQGAGAADIYNAILSPVYLTVLQANGEKTPKVSFGDDPQRTGVYTFSFMMHNFSTADQLYTLEGIAMTDQYVALEDGREYMGETGRILSGDVLFEVLSGAVDLQYDANQDGLVNMDDVQFLLDVVNGLETLDASLNEMMDLDGNTVLNTVDVQILYLKLLAGFQPETQVMVPAGTSITVNVTVKLSAEDKAYMDAHYENGIYVEGFVRCYAENENGQDLSLPFMGFYGEWSDAPVIDSGWYYEDMDTVEYNRYLNVLYSNMGTSYGGLGLNPYLTNEVYDPEHNVLSPNGDGYYDYINEIYISQLRSAELMTFTWTDAAGTELFNDYLVYLKKSFYWAAYGMCLPTVYTDQGGQIFVMHDEEGNPLFEDLTRMQLTIRAYLDDGDLDEVEVDANGAPLPDVSWADDVVEVPVVIDTTAPTLDISSIQYETKDGRNYVTFLVEDNYDVAALVTTTMGGDVYEYHAVTGKKPGVDGEKATVTLDITDYDGSFCVVVCDYGCNETYYELTNKDFQGMSQDRFYAFRRYSTPVMGDTVYMTDQLNGWYSFSSADEMLMHTSQPESGEATVYAAEYVDGYIFGAQACAYNSTNVLFVMKEGSWERTVIGSQYGMKKTVYKWPGSTGTYFPLELIALDMAYDYTSDTMYLLANALPNSYFENGVENLLLEVDIHTGAWNILGLIQEANGKPFIALTLACDNDGILYTVNYEDGKIYTIDKTPASTEADMGFYTATCLSQKNTPYYPAAYTQSMAVDHETNRLYWAGYQGRTGTAYFFEVDKTTGELISYTQTEDNAEMVGMFKPYDSGEDIIADAALEGIRLNYTELSMHVGDNATLTASAEPYNGKLGELTFTSLDESVAVVSANGIVEAKSVGTAAILVSCQTADGYFEAICTVNVSNVSGTMFAYSDSYWMMMDAGAPDAAVQLVDTMELDGKVTAAVYLQGYVYAAAVVEDYDADWNPVYTTNFYKLDADTLFGELVGTYEGKTTALAFNYADGNMYAMVRNLNPITYGYEYTLARVNPRTGMIDPAASLDEMFDNANEWEECSGALAIDNEGNFYVTGSNLNEYDEYANVLIRFNLDENDQLTNETIWDQLPGYSADGGEAMVWSERNGGILRSSVDPETYQYNLYWLDVSDMEHVEQICLGEIRGASSPGVAALVMLLNREPEMPDIPATDVFLDASYTLFQGETLKVVPGTEPWNATVEFAYEIADPTIASVDRNGVITGLAVGETTITVTVPGTDLSATATVVVEKNPGYLFGFFQADIAQGIPLEQWGRIPLADSANSTYLTFSAYDFTIYAATFYDGYVYAYGKSQYDYLFYFLRISPSSFSYEVIAQGDVLLRDMAFDFTTGTLYGVGYTEMVSGGLYQIDVDTGKMTLVADNDTGATLVALAADDQGVLYVADDYGEVMIMDKHTGVLTATGIYGGASQYLQSMTYDYNNDAIFWALGGTLYRIDTENNELITVGQVDINSGEMFTVGCVVSGLFSVPSAENMPQIPETVDPQGVVLDEKNTVAVGQSLQLEAVVLPVSQSAVDQTLTWSSSNEAIATVVNGVVTGVAAGDAIITATDTKGNSDSVLITVTAEARLFYGYDELSNSWVSFGFDGKIVETWADDEDLSPIVAAQYIGTKLYAYDAEGYFYTVDTETFQRTKLGDGIHGLTVDLQTNDRVNGNGWNYDVPYQVIDMTYAKTARGYVAYAVLMAYSVSEWLDDFSYQVVRINLSTGEVAETIVKDTLVDNEMSLRPTNLIYRNGYLYTVNGYITGMITQIDPAFGTVTGTAIFAEYWGDFNGARSFIEDPLTGEVYALRDMRTQYIGVPDYDPSIAETVLCTIDIGVAGCDEVCKLPGNIRLCGLFIK